VLHVGDIAARVHHLKSIAVVTHQPLDLALYGLNFLRKLILNLNQG
jgi:hypothetical protein